MSRAGVREVTSRWLGVRDITCLRPRSHEPLSAISRPILDSGRTNGESPRDIADICRGGAREIADF